MREPWTCRLLPQFHFCYINAYMYGMPVKRFDYDIYRDNKARKRFDFCVGFVASALLWYLLFEPVWYTAIMIILSACVVGLIVKFERRYMIYGAFVLVFLPFVIWATLFSGWMGRNEVNS
jgi:hypothetical protein